MTELSTDRLRALAAVLELSEPLESAKAKLHVFSWNYDGICLKMTRAHVANVLRRFLAGEIGKDSIADWADLLEMREDIDYDDDARDWLTDALFELSTPEINGALTIERARKLLEEAST